MFTNPVQPSRVLPSLAADIALKGRDNFSIFVDCGGIVTLEELIGYSPADLVEKKIIEAQNRKRVPRSRMIADADGVGGFVGDYIKQMKEFHGNGAPLDRKYTNIKSQCYYKLAEKVNGRKIKVVGRDGQPLPPDVQEKIKNQLTAIKIEHPNKRHYLAGNPQTLATPWQCCNISIYKLQAVQLSAWAKYKIMAIITTYGDLLRLYPYLTDESRARVATRVKGAPKPLAICGHMLPANLNEITFGQLTELQTAANADDAILTTARALFPTITADDMERVNVFVACGFLQWVGKEVERINKLWDGLRVKHTPQEIMAGAEKLNFGTFGVLDWYAKRQGITDQDEVNNIAWVRLYACMKQDNERAMYERRLNNIYMSNLNKKKK